MVFAAASAGTVTPFAGNLPMHFEPNVGQVDQHVEFLARGPGYTLFLTPTQAVLVLRTTGAASRSAQEDSRREGPKEHRALTDAKPLQTELRMTIAGANPQPRIAGADELSGTVNYFLGADSSRWRTGIHPFAKARFEQVYPGVDMVYYGDQRRLEYDFVVGAGADPGVIALDFEGVEWLELDAQGELVLHLAGGAVRWRKPVVYQEAAAGREMIPGEFVVKGPRQIGFCLGDYDHSRPLIIDPVMVYSTYLGGNNADFIAAIVAGSNGTVYVAGNTVSPNFPVLSAYRATPVGLNDAFVTKLNSNGTALVYSTYLGGTGDDFAYALAVDSAGNAYVGGYEESTNFPVVGAFQSANGGYGDAFIAKLGPAGNTLLYSSLLGAGQDEGINAVAVDNAGRAYVAGFTYSARNFITKNPFQAKAGGYPNDNNEDAFVAKFNTTTTGSASLVYSSWLGGSSYETAYAIAVDAAGNVYVGGEVADKTSFPPTIPHSDFPTVSAFQSSFNRGGTDPYSGVTDGFLTKVNPNGDGMLFSTFLGGAGEEAVFSLTLDSIGRIYLSGRTSSTNFPILNAVQPTLGDQGQFLTTDLFATVLQSNGTSLYYSTFLGGTLSENQLSPSGGIAVDGSGNIYLAGDTQSDDFPITVGADQTNSGGGVVVVDGFVAEINPAVPGPSGLIFSSFINGFDDDHATAIAMGSNGTYFVAGYTLSDDIPITTGSYRVTNSGGYSDGFVMKFSSPSDLSVSMIPSLDPVMVGSNLTYTIQVNNNGLTTFSGVTNTIQLSTNVQVISVSTTAGTWTTNGNSLVFNLGTLTTNAQISHVVVVTNKAPGNFTNTAILTSTGAESNTGNNVAAIPCLVRGFADLAILNTSAPNPVFVTSNLTYTLLVSNRGPWSASSLVITDTLPAGVDFISAVASRGAVDTNDTASEIYWNVVGTPLAVGGTVTLTITAKAVTTGSAVSIARVSAYELDLVTTNNAATNTTTISLLSDLTLGKTASTNTILAGANLVYTLRVTNNGPSTATGVVLADILPPSFTYVSASTTATVSNNVVTCSLANLASNGTATVTITAKPNVPGVVTNTATIAATPADLVSDNNSAAATVTVIGATDVAVSKSGSPSSQLLSGPVNYTLIVTNRGPSTAVGVVLTDTLPSGLTYNSTLPSQGTFTQSNGVVTCNLGNINSNSSAAVVITTTANAVGSRTNTAVVTTITPELNAADNTASAVTIVNAAADLSLSKSAAPNPAYVGSNIVYTLNVANPGPSAATNVVLTDTLPAGMTFLFATVSQGAFSQNSGVVTCTLGTVNSNATALVTITTRANVAGNLTNFASVTAITADLNTNNNTASAVTAVSPVAELSLSKTASPAAVAVGGFVTYTLVVSNRGPATATSVVLTDPLPAGMAYLSGGPSQGVVSETNGVVTCGFGSIASNAFATLTIIGSPTLTGVITNSATVTAITTDFIPSNNTASAVTYVNPPGDLSLTKTGSPDPAFLGSNITYTLVFANPGPDLATNVVIADSLPPEVTFVSAAPSQGSFTQTNGVVTGSLGDVPANTTATVTIIASPNVAAITTNFASFTATSTDTNFVNDTAFFVSSINPAADLAVTKSVQPAAQLVGSNVTFTIVVTNQGPSPAFGVGLTDALPAGLNYVSATPSQGTFAQNGGVVTCNLGNLATNGAASVTIVASTTQAGLFTNTATVSAATADVNPANNTAAVVSIISPAGDLSLIKTVSAGPLYVGSNLTYTLIVANPGPSPATSVVITDALPASVTYISATPSQGNVSQNNGVVTCNFGGIISNATASVTIVARPNAAGNVTNTATVTTATTDVNLSNNTASVVSVIVAAADVSVSKTVSANPAYVSNNIVYTMVVSNRGPSQAVGVVLTDPLPAGVTYVSATTSQGSFGQTNGVVTANLGNVSSNATATVTITARVILAGTITNSASLTATTADLNPANNSAAVVSTNLGTADLAVTKTVTPNLQYLGGNLTYTIGVSNRGPAVSVGAVLTDTLPAGVAFVSAAPSQGTFTQTNGVVTCALGNISINATAAVTITAVATATGTVVNSATVTAATADLVSGNNTATATSTNLAAADVSLFKSVSPAQLFVGSNLTYTLAVTNRGPSPSTNVVLTDPLPAGLTYFSSTATQGVLTQTNGVVTCSFGMLNSNATATVTVTATPAAAGNFTNSASVTTTTTDVNLSNNTASVVSVITASADLSVAKTGTPAAQYVGSNVTYTVVVTNRGPSAAAGVALTDALPAGMNFVTATTSQGSFTQSNGVVTCNLGGLNSNVTATVTITATPTTTGTFTNTASVAASTADLNSANNTASAVSTINPAADVTLFKTVAPNPQYVGSNVTYTLIVTNRGPSPSVGLLLTDALPAGMAYVSGTTSQGSFTQSNGVVTCDLGNLNSNATVTVTITATASSAGSLTNTASVTGPTTDLNPANNTAAIVSTNVAAADLAVTKTVSGGPQYVGSNITYTVVVTNRGPSAAAGVVLTDALPAGMNFVTATPSQGTVTQTNGVVSCNLGSLDLNATATVTITATPSAAGNFNNSASVTAVTADLVSANNTASAASSVTALADLSVAKTVTPAAQYVGSNVTYTVVVTNRGPSAAAGVALTDALPAGMNFVSATTSQGSFTQSNGVVTCVLGSLASNATATVTITATPTTTGSFTNTASVTATTTDLNSANNSAFAVSSISAAADVTLFKTVAPNLQYVGSNVVYTLLVTNRGPSPSVVSLTDALPAGMAYVSGTTSQGALTQTNGVVTCDLGSLNSNATATVTITATATSAGTITNTASVTGSTTDLSSGNNTSSIVSTNVAAADLAVTKTVSAGPQYVGSNITYTVVVTNRGPSLSTGVVLVDALPAAMNFVSVAPSQGTFTQNNGVVTCNLGSLDLNTSATVTITATPNAPGNFTNTASVTAATADLVSANNTASAASSVSAAADLAVGKTVSPASQFLGGNITYTIGVTNHGPSPAAGVVLTDALPAGMNFVTATTSQGSFSQSNGVVTCNLGGLTSNATATVTITATPATTETFTNTASVTATTADLISANNAASAVSIINAAGDLSLSKSATPDPAFLGGNIAYTLTVANPGPSPAAGVVLTDALPAGMTYNSATTSQGSFSQSNGVVSCDLGTIDSNVTATVTITVTPTVTGSITNTANVATTTTDLNASNNTATVVSTVNPSADLGLTKTVAPNPQSVGGSVTYTLVVTNRGPSLSTSVVLTDALPAGLAYVSATPSQGTFTQSNGVVACDLGDLNLNSSATVTIIATATTAGNLTNTASVTAATADLNIADNTAAVVSTNVAAADLSLSKTGSPGTVFVGGNLTYTLTVSNPGPSSASGVVLTDPLPAGVAFVSAASSQGTFAQSNGVVIGNLGNIGSNATATVTITAMPTTAGTFTNTASVTAATADSNAANNTASAVSTANATADLAVSKTVAPDPQFAGNNLTYTIVVTNFGPSPATGVVLADPLPVGLSYVSATTSQGSFSQSNGVVSCDLGTINSNVTATVTITATANVTGSITNTANVAATTADSNVANNTATIVSTVNPSADLRLSKTVAPNPQSVGGNVTYTLVVTNRGPSLSTGVVLTDALPAGLAYVSAAASQGTFAQSNGVVACNLGGVNAGASATVTITATAISAGKVTNTASVTAATTDLNPADNAASAVSTNVAASDLSLTKTVAPGAVYVAGRINYTLTVSNPGPSSATGVVLNDPLPAGLAYVSVAPSQGGFSQSNGLVTCTLGNIASNATATVTLVARPTVPGTFTNTASVAAATADLNPANNSASVASVVDAAADLAVSKTVAPDPQFAGSHLTYTIVVTNSGPSPASGVVLTDPLPLGMAYISAAPSQGSFTQSNRVVTCNFGSVASGATAAVTIVVNPNLPGTFTNTTTVTATTTDPVSSNNAASAVSVINAAADLVVFKSASANAAFLGDYITFTIVVSNRGPSSASNVMLTDPLPNGLTVISSQTSQGASSTSNDVVTCALGNLISGATASVNIVAQATLIGTLINNASGTSAVTDPAPGDNSGTATVTISDVPIISVFVNRYSSNTVVISWPTNPPGFGLQFTTNLSPPNTVWTPVTNVPAVVNDQFTVTNRPPPTPKLYRLIH